MFLVSGYLQGQDLWAYVGWIHEELPSSLEVLFWTLMVFAASFWVSPPQAVAPAARLPVSPQAS